METTVSRYRWLNMVLILMLLPTAYFIMAAFLKYELGVQGPYDTVAPWLEKMGIKETLGWNINGFIIFGPLIALAVSVLQVLAAEWNFTKEQFQFRIIIVKRIVIACRK